MIRDTDVCALYRVMEKLLNVFWAVPLCFQVLGRPGFSIADKKRKTGRIGFRHRIRKEEAMRWFQQKVSVVVVLAYFYRPGNFRRAYKVVLKELIGTKWTIWGCLTPTWPSVKALESVFLNNASIEVSGRTFKTLTLNPSDWVYQTTSSVDASLNRVKLTSELEFINF